MLPSSEGSARPVWSSGSGQAGDGGDEAAAASSVLNASPNPASLSLQQDEPSVKPPAATSAALKPTAAAKFKARQNIPKDLESRHGPDHVLPPRLPMQHSIPLGPGNASSTTAGSSAALAAISAEERNAGQANAQGNDGSRRLHDKSAAPEAAAAVSPSAALPRLNLAEDGHTSSADPEDAEPNLRHSPRPMPSQQVIHMHTTRCIAYHETVDVYSSGTHAYRRQQHETYSIAASPVKQAPLSNVACLLCTAMQLNHAQQSQPGSTELSRLSAGKIKIRMSPKIRMTFLITLWYGYCVPSAVKGFGSPQPAKTINGHHGYCTIQDSWLQGAQKLQLPCTGNRRVGL